MKPTKRTGRPPLSADGPSVPLRLKVPPDVYDALRQMAEALEYRSAGVAARVVLTNWAREQNLLRELAGSGVTMDDHRIDYVEVQIDRATWDALQAAVRGKGPDRRAPMPVRNMPRGGRDRSRG